MRKIKTFIILATVSVIWVSCSVDPEPIDYGNHNCDFCEMTIMDQRYGSEIVTEKGKVYMFDAIECMANFTMKEMPEGEKPELVLFTSYENPGHLVEAGNGIILHSQGLPSPMGMYLTGFADREKAGEMQASHGGTLYEWEELLDNFDQVRKGF